jgi:IclR family acetate operon transcriptional repressor
MLELLLGEPHGLTLTQISQRLGVPASSSHALAHTLIRRGYLVRSDDLTIHLGPKLCQYAAVFADQLELIPMAEPVMGLVCRLSGKTVSLAVLEGAEIVFIHKKPARNTLHVVNPVGTRLPAHATGLGKAILSLLPREELDQLYPREELKPVTPNTLTRKSELLSVLECVRREGVAYDREESSLGIFAVGSAIRNHYSQPVAAMSVVLPAAQADASLQPRWAALVRAAGMVLSYRLGYPASGILHLSMLTEVWEQPQPGCHQPSE